MRVVAVFVLVACAVSALAGSTGTLGQVPCYPNTISGEFFTDLPSGTDRLEEYAYYQIDHEAGAIYSVGYDWNLNKMMGGMFHFLQVEDNAWVWIGKAGDSNFKCFSAPTTPLLKNGCLPEDTVYAGAITVGTLPTAVYHSESLNTTFGTTIADPEGYVWPVFAFESGVVSSSSSKYSGFGSAPTERLFFNPSTTVITGLWTPPKGCPKGEN